MYCLDQISFPFLIPYLLQLYFTFMSYLWYDKRYKRINSYFSMNMVLLRKKKTPGNQLIHAEKEAEDQRKHEEDGFDQNVMISI